MKEHVAANASLKAAQVAWLNDRNNQALRDADTAACERANASWAALEAAVTTLSEKATQQGGSS